MPAQGPDFKELFEQRERVRKGWFPKKPDKREP